MSKVSEAIRKKLIEDTGTLGLMNATTGVITGVFDDVAPEDYKEYPFIVVSVQSPAIPSYSLGPSTPFLEGSVITARVVDNQLSAARAEDLAERIKEVLQDASLEIRGQVPLWCRWKQEVDYSTVERGETFRHKGAQWDVKAGPQ
jgi:hypothetical protein